jgi:palmitoyltransferase ZDHHC9/14/18
MKPASAMRLEKREKEAALRESIQLAPSAPIEVEGYSVPETRTSYRPSRQSQQPRDLRSPSPDFVTDDILSAPVGHPAPWEQDPTHTQSITDTSSPPRRHLPELSSDHLVNYPTVNSMSFGHRDSTLADLRAHAQDSPDLVAVKPQTGEQPGQKPQGRIRKYQKFDNDQTTFFARGKLMTGGDNPWSMIMTLVILFGLTGVWVGTTGVWLWVDGERYGLNKGAGIAIVVVFV